MMPVQSRRPTWNGLPLQSSVSVYRLSTITKENLAITLFKFVAVNMIQNLGGVNADS